MKKIFLGTPFISAEILDDLLKKNIIFDAVITSPDKPVGRKKLITPPPVKEVALRYGIEVFQPFDEHELDETIKKILPDFGIVVAYGMIIMKKTIDKVKYGFFNLHFSLLPKYRGADPVRWALINGERESGITVFKIDEGLDTGPILLQEKIIIEQDDTYVSLFNKMKEASCKFLPQVINSIENESYTLFPQLGNPSYAPKISVNDTYIDFNNEVDKVFNRIRAFSVDPYARFVFNSGSKRIVIQVISAQMLNIDYPDFKPGQICDFGKEKGIFVKCLKGCVIIKTIKPEGKREMPAYDYFINGFRLKKGDSIV